MLPKRPKLYIRAAKFSVCFRRQVFHVLCMDKHACSSVSQSGRARLSGNIYLSSVSLYVVTSPGSTVLLASVHLQDFSYAGYIHMQALAYCTLRILLIFLKAM